MTDFQQETDFIPAGENLESGHPLLRNWAEKPLDALRKRWDTPEGTRILSAWRESGFERSSLAGLVGRYHNHIDLRGIPLVGADLKEKDLSEIDFAGATFQSANLYGANLTGSWLSYSDLRSACLNFARLDGALVDRVRYDANTSFVGVNLNAVNFTLAARLQDLAVTQQRIADLEERSPIIAFLLRVSCDYGRSFSRFFFWAGTAIVLFALAYWAFGALSREGLSHAFYFSVITFTTLGYGDVLPTGVCGMVLAALEVITGVLMLGLLVAIISRRVIGS